MSSSKVAAVIQFKASAKGQENGNVANLLKAGREIVQTTEPKTEQWWAGQKIDLSTGEPKLVADEFVILDFFTDMSGAEAHLAGGVPKAAAANNDYFVDGAQAGVLDQLQTFSLVTEQPKLTESEKMKKAQYLVYFPVTAAEGEEEAMEGLLKVGLQLVTEKEEGTSFWAAVKLNGETGKYAIIDTFDDFGAVKAHLVSPAVVPTAIQSGNEHLFAEGSFAKAAEKACVYCIIDTDIKVSGDEASTDARAADPTKPAATAQVETDQVRAEAQATRVAKAREQVNDAAERFRRVRAARAARAAAGAEAGREIVQTTEPKTEQW